ncbi:MAG TPA: PDZ domain-containing protein [Kofleriaceae bacterium]|nr:PDZ domain-containing protein [Kofleriaceae bacterium]
MRFVSALLSVALTGSLALADEAKPADPKPEVTKQKVPLRVVKMLPETRQVLLFDRNKGTHVVAEVGQEVDGYIVDEIDGDEVTLVAGSGTEVILTAPERGSRRKDAERKAAARTAAGAKAPAEPAPEDPYAEQAPIAGENGVRVTPAPGAPAAGFVDASPAPADPYADMDPGVAAFVKAVGATPTPPTATAASPAATPAPPPTAAPAPASSAPRAPTKASSDGAALGAAIAGAPAPETAAPAPAAAGPTTASVKRAEIDAALADFGATASTFRATFVAQGLRFDDVTGGSLLARVGLQKGDIVTTVDGQPLRSLDDAANLYARLPTARGTTLAVLRAGKPVTLRVAIQ